MRRALLVLLLIVPLFASAQEQEDNWLWSNIDLGVVVVTGTRTPRLLKDVPVQTRVISSKDIEHTDATNIQDLLQTELPGVEFSYAMNQQVNMNLSGFAGQGVLILVNGERLAGETMDNVDFTRLSMSNVEKVEIVKSCASALYGSSASGGVINIITKNQTKAFSLNADARWGQHNSQRYSVDLGFKHGICANTLSVQRTAIDNYAVHSKPEGAKTSTFSEVFGDKTWNFADRLTISPNDKLKLSARLGYFFRTLSRVEDTPERYRDYTAGARLEYTTDANRFELSYGFDQYDKSDYQKIKDLDIRRYSNVQNTVKALFTHTYQSGNQLIVGADYMYDYLMNNNLNDGEHHQTSADIFAQYDWIISDRWEVIGALRYDYVSDGDMQHVTPRISARWKPFLESPLRGLAIRAGYGMGFRTPTLKEKYYNFDMAGIWIVQGSPLLDAETSHNVNLSAELTKGLYNFTISGYYNKVSDRITTGLPYYKPEDPNQLYLDYVNLGKMDVYGFEATAQARWQCGIGAKLSYTFTHEDNGTSTANQYMPARNHSLTARVDWDKTWTDKVSSVLSLSGRAVSGVDNTEYVDIYDVSKGTNEIHYPAYSLWKLQASVRFWKKLQVNVTVDNIFNYKPDYYYYNAPLTTGTALLAGLSFTL